MKNKLIRLLLGATFIITTNTNAQDMSFVKKIPAATGVQINQNNFLSSDQAFLFSAKMLPNNIIEVKWGADEGYHLYHESLKFEVTDLNGHNNSSVKLGVINLPSGKKTYISALGKEIEEHTGVFTSLIPVKGHGDFILKAYAQGCADKGLCYPPFVREQKLKAN